MSTVLQTPPSLRDTSPNFGEDNSPHPPFGHCSAGTPSAITTTPPNLPFRRGGEQTSPALRAPSPNLGEGFWEVWEMKNAE